MKGSFLAGKPRPLGWEFQLALFIRRRPTGSARYDPFPLYLDLYVRGVAMDKRIKVLQQRLSAGGIDAALLVYSRDVLYYTGTAQPSCLLVTPDAYTLYVRSGFEFAVQDVFIGREKLFEERRLEKVLAGALSRLGGNGERSVRSSTS